MKYIFLSLASNISTVPIRAKPISGDVQSSMVLEKRCGYYKTGGSDHKRCVE